MMTDVRKCGLWSSARREDLIEGSTICEMALPGLEPASKISVELGKGQDRRLV